MRILRTVAHNYPVVDRPLQVLQQVALLAHLLVLLRLLVKTFRHHPAGHPLLFPSLHHLDVDPVFLVHRFQHFRGLRLFHLVFERVDHGPDAPVKQVLVVVALVIQCLP